MTPTDLDLSDLVVLGEPVVVEDCEDEGLVEGLAVGDALEGERLVEERVQRLPVHLRLELALLVRHQVDLSARARASEKSCRNPHVLHARLLATSPKP